MGNKKYAKSPLLYIRQPNIGTPEASMQHHYVTPKKTPKQEEQETNKVQKRPLKRTISNQQNKHDESESDNEAMAEKEELVEEKSVKESQGRKKFKDMTLRERVDYFVNTPKYAPLMKCEVKTDERNYRGIIVDFQEEQVFMRVGRRTSPTKIPFETIEEIRLLGF